MVEWLGLQKLGEVWWGEVWIGGAGAMSCDRLILIAIFS